MAAMALQTRVREGVDELVAQLGDAGTGVEICRAIELEANLRRAQYAMVACMARDDFSLGLAEHGELTARGRRLKTMLNVRVHEHEVDGEGRARIYTVVDVADLRQPVALQFSYTCAPAKEGQTTWNVIYFVSVSYSHGPARKLLVLRVRNAPQCYPSPDGSDKKRVFVSGARLEKLTKVLRLGLQPPEVLQLLLAFDLFDEEWDVANTILDAMDDEEDGSDAGSEQ
jgi:hypothetical protein